MSAIRDADLMPPVKGTQRFDKIALSRVRRSKHARYLGRAPTIRGRGAQELMGHSQLLRILRTHTTNSDKEPTSVLRSLGLCRSRTHDLPICLVAHIFPIMFRDKALQPSLINLLVLTLFVGK